MASCAMALDLVCMLSARGDVGPPCVGDGTGGGTLGGGLDDGTSIHGVTVIIRDEGRLWCCVQ